MSADESITSLSEAVAERGALPMPAGPVLKPMSAERLAEIEARERAATAGPWCTDSWEIYQGAEYEPGLSFWIGETCRGTTDLEQDRADAAFVAAARSDVPALVAEVRRQAARIAELEAERLSAVECVCPPADRVGPHQVGCPSDGVPDRLTAVFVPVASLRVDVPDGEHWAAVHHDWRLSRDLPETGGAR